MLPAFPANGYAIEEAGVDSVPIPSIKLTGTESIEQEVPAAEDGGDAVKV